jgi:hypothetical protein
LKNGPSEVKIFVFEIGHIGYKNQEFYADLKNATLVSKCPQKKLKLTKKWDLAKLENRFLLFTFLGGIL